MQGATVKVVEEDGLTVVAAVHEVVAGRLCPLPAACDAGHDQPSGAVRKPFEPDLERGGWSLE
jgi:hypothetical protein